MKTSWYREPWAWLVFILPFTAVVAGITTYIIANTDPDSLVVGDYYKSGKAINFTPARYLQAIKLDAIQQHLIDQKGVYTKQGFKVVDLHGDGHINHGYLEHALLPTKIHAYSKNEHVGMIEHEHRTVKESLRSVTYSLPYTHAPLLMIIELVQHIVDMKSRQPSAQGNYGGMTNAEIVKGIGRIEKVADN